MRRNEIKIMPAQLNRIAKYTTQQEFDLVRDVLSTDLKSLDKPTLKKRIRVLRRHADKARGRAVTEARKGVSGELSKRKMGIFLEALQKCEHYLLDIEVEEAREQHKAAARKALEKKRSSADRTMPRPSSRTGRDWHGVQTKDQACASIDCRSCERTCPWGSAPGAG
jgi:hypothetical protein